MGRHRKQFSDPIQQEIHLKKLEREKEISEMKRLGTWERPKKTIEDMRKYRREWERNNKRQRVKVEPQISSGKRTIESETKLIDEIIEWLAYNSPFDKEYTNKLSELAIVENRLENLKRA